MKERPRKPSDGRACAALMLVTERRFLPAVNQLAPWMVNDPLRALRTNQQIGARTGTGAKLSDFCPLLCCTMAANRTLQLGCGQHRVFASRKQPCVASCWQPW